MRRPRWNSGWNRPLALVELVVQPLVIPVAILCYGLPALKDQARHWRFLGKTIWYGRIGPNPWSIW